MQVCSACNLILGTNLQSFQGVCWLLHHEAGHAWPQDAKFCCTGGGLFNTKPVKSYL
jgi:hypothetical protein